MKSQLTVGLAMLTGIGVGALAVQTLHAQGKNPVYVVTEIDISNLDGFKKEYAPRSQAIIRKSGGKILASSENVTPLEGTPPKSRATIQLWDNLEQAKAWRNSAEYKEVRSIGDKYAKFRAYAVEAQPQ